MKIAIFGSRKITDIELASFIPADVTELVSGGAVGVDAVAASYARANGIKLVEFLPDYELFGKRAPIVRDKQIAEYADIGFAFWDGSSKGTVHTVNFFKDLRKPVRIFVKTK